ncbi:MarR family winged helix-turn-helix transcriptional regulator [Chloroflexota bacterium]
MARIREINHSESVGKTLMLLTQTSRLVDKYMDTYFYRKTRLSFIKFMVLKILASNNGVMAPSKIAEWTQTERHNITALVSRLKKEDLVLTEPSDRDKRSISVILTDEGREMLNKAMPVARDIIEQIMSSFTEPDSLKLSQMLEVLRDNAHCALEDIAR